MPQITTKHRLILDLLESIVARGPTQTTLLIICHSRSDFLTQLQTSVASWQPPADEIPASPTDEGEEIQDEEAQQRQTDDNKVKHAFMTPTLHLLSTSRSVKMVFCPSINTLRAFIATYVPPSTNTNETHPASDVAQLLILDLLALHHGTSEYTMQGLSRTFAAVASMAHRTKLALQLVECEDVHDRAAPSRGPALWDDEVPLLGGSIKLGGAGASWAGRRVGVRTIAARWFEFDK